MSHEKMSNSEEESIMLSQQQQHMRNTMKREQSRLNTIVMKNLMKNQSLAVNFSGIIRSGVFKDDNTLSLLYSCYYGQTWELAGGQKSGISMKCEAGQGRIVWNFPFGFTFKTKNIEDWPQIVIVIYGTDYFGRSVPRGYGNMHLPTSQGIHRRKLRIFRPIQPNTFFWSCLNYLTSSILQIKQPQTFLCSDKDRKNLKVYYSGQIQIEVETKLINLQKHGYI